jgi:hypothetical protein
MIVVETIIEIAGFPEKHVEETMQKVLDKLKEEKGINTIKKNVVPVKQVKQLWSTYVELDLKMKDLQTLMGFCFDYMPSSVQIVEPKDLSLESVKLSNSINDMLEKLHKFQMFISNLNAENILLKKKLGIGEED